MSTLLPPDQFAEVVRLAPLVSIDLILRDPRNRILVGLRNNDPARDFYFVPGGVVLKDERLDDAFRRNLHKETGLAGERSDARFLGVFEHHYPNNFTGSDFTTHYVVLAYEFAVIDLSRLHQDAQHRRLRWLTETEILAAPDVHERTKDYVRRHS